MKEVDISEFKAKCLGLIEQVRKTKQPLRITRLGTPLAELRLPAASSDWIGSMKNIMRIGGDIVSPATEENEWDALRD